MPARLFFSDRRRSFESLRIHHLPEEKARQEKTADSSSVEDISLWQQSTREILRIKRTGNKKKVTVLKKEDRKSVV